jgi:prevent-host-death family protein
VSLVRFVRFVYLADMEREIGSDDARRNWRELLNAVENGGEHVTILRWGKPAVVVVPAGWHDQALGKETS